jgi:hypothetical protein
MYTARQFENDLADAIIGTADGGDFTSKAQWHAHCMALRDWLINLRRLKHVSKIRASFVNARGSLLWGVRLMRQKTMLPSDIFQKRGLVLMAQLESEEWMLGASYASARDHFYKVEAWGRAIRRLQIVPITFLTAGGLHERYLEAGRDWQRKLDGAELRFQEARTDFEKALPGLPPSTYAPICSEMLAIKTPADVRWNTDRMENVYAAAGIADAR